MKLVILQREITAKEVMYIVSEVKEARIIHAHREQLPASLSQLSHQQVETPSNLVQNCTTMAFEQALSFGHRKWNGKSFIDTISLEKGDVWYFLRFLLNSKYRGTLINAAYVQYVLTETDWGREADRVDIYTNDGDIGFLVPHDQKQIQIKLGKRSIEKTLVSLLKFSMRFMARIMISLIQLPNLLRRYDHLVYMDLNHQRQIFSPSYKRHIIGNPFFHSLLEEGLKSGQYLPIIEASPKKLDGTAKISKEMFWPKFVWRSISFEPFILLAFFSPALYKKRRRLKAKLFGIQKHSQNLIKDQHEELILKKLLRMRRLMFYSIVRTEASKLMFCFLDKAKTFTCLDENGSLCRPFINMARTKGIISVGVQHGLFYPMHASYIYSKDDLPYRPFPDHTIVWGQKWKVALMKQSVYDEGSLHILGNLTTDQIGYYKEYNKSNTLGIDASVPVIFYASQPLFEGQEEIRKALVKSFLALTLKFPDCCFVIKPHPREKDETVFHEVAQNLGTKNYRIYRGELYKLLSISDMAVVYYSTVGLEAALFHKPLVILDFWDEDLSGFVKQGIGTKAGSAEELELIVANFLAGKGEFQEQRKQEQFVEEYYYKVDGQTAKRYHLFLDQLASSKNGRQSVSNHTL